MCGGGGESARLIARRAAGSQSILWEWVNKQRVINAFIQKGEMFCMAWFMELSRLSNSLGSVCSQRRGPAGGCSGPSLTRSLTLWAITPLHSPPTGPTGAFFSPVHERPPAADPAGLLCLLVLNAAPGGPLMWAQPPRGPWSQALLSQWDVWLAATFHTTTPYKSPNLRGCCGIKS